jgi:hypothetical protein
MDVQKPVVARAVASEPVQRERRNLIGGLDSHRAEIDHLVEARIPMIRGMTLAERADSRCMHSDRAHSPRPTGRCAARLKSPCRTFEKWIGRRPAMTDDAVMDPEAA